MKFFSKKKIFFGLIILAILAGGGYFFFNRDVTSKNEFVLAERQNIIQEVSATGKVRPAQAVDLAFEVNGKVYAVYSQVGDKIFAGQSLISLVSAELIAQLKGAEADLLAQEAKLDELKKGTRPEEIEVYKVKVANAETSLIDAKQNLIDKIKDAYLKSDDAVRAKADQFFSNGQSGNAKLNFSAPNTGSAMLLENLRNEVEFNLTSWYIWLGNLKIDTNLLSKSLEAQNYLSKIQSFLDKASEVINSLAANSTLTQTTIDGWKTDLSTARTNVSTGVVNLTTAVEKLKTAQSTLSLAREELRLKEAGNVPEQIKIQEANVVSAQATIEKIKAQLAKNTLRAPIAGIITKQEAKSGEIVSANSVLISMISEAEYEIEANIPEADIAKIKVGNNVKVTLDAYGDDVIFNAKITKIDPAETIVEGISTYKTTFQFLQKDTRIISGMTANLDITTETKENVISIPFRAVVNKNGKKFAKIIKSNEEIIEVEVKTGLRGSDGNIEITQGINEGDKVIVFQKED